MDATETATELQRIRDRIHDLAEVVHQHGNRIEIGKLERDHLKETMKSMATSEQVEQIRRDVAAITSVITRLAWVIVLAVIGSGLGMILAK